MKKTNIFIITVLILIVVGTLGAFVLNAKYESEISVQNSDLDKTIDITINNGETLDQIIDKLTTNGLISKDRQIYFKIYVNRENLSTKFQAGDFRIPQNLTIKEIAQTLQRAGLPDFWITFPEGLRKAQMAENISIELTGKPNATFDKNEFLRLTTDKEFITSLQLPFEVDDLEGVLFPDRYLLPIGISSKDVIIVMVNNFKRKAPAGLTYDDLKIASYLEKEGKATDDRKIIADIIKRRLKEGWYLNIDATLQYYETETKTTLTAQDIQTDGPYNTYTRLGLTPTPICNPGLDSINAAINPTPNIYYFYLHDKSGNAHYAINIKGQEQNIQQYLQ